ncbi:MAG: hypothetical protein H7A25_00435 [Leptospiraceae bacterium]|nr:hypothetical protein [Leptospiraceae bacterium]
MKLLYILIGLSLTTGIFAQDNAAGAAGSGSSGDSNTTYTVELDGEGNPKMRNLPSEDSRKELEEDVKNLEKDIKFFSEKIQKLVPYLKKYRADEVKDNKFTRQTEAYKNSIQGQVYHYMINESFTLDLGSNELSFKQRKGRLGARTYELTQIRELSGKGDAASVKLTIQKYTQYGKLDLEVVEYGKIMDPSYRVRILRNYRNMVEGAARTLDKLVEGAIHKDYVKVANSIRDIDTN